MKVDVRVCRDQRTKNDMDESGVTDVRIVNVRDTVVLPHARKNDKYIR